MKSPCYDCNLRDEDKNGKTCTECDARYRYASSFLADQLPVIVEKRRYETMGVKGTCKNCERKDMSLPARGLCGLCHGAWWKAPVDGKEAALAAAKEKVQSGIDLKRRPRCKKPKQTANKSKAKDLADFVDAEKPVALMNEFKMSIGEAVSGVDVVCLEFKDERDMNIREWIDKQAKESRRNPDQQIMWILQHYIEATPDLNPEP